MIRVPEARLDVVARCMPALRARFSSFQSFADAGIDEILGERFSRSSFVEANWLQSTVFVNRGDRFEAVIMPREAQLAPAFGVAVAGVLDLLES